MKVKVLITVLVFVSLILVQTYYSPEAGAASCTVTFGDVPSGYWAEGFIKTLYCRGVTSGCSANPLLYCPESNVTRAEMAVFIIRSNDTFREITL